MSQITNEFIPLPPLQYYYVYAGIAANSLAVFTVTILIYCIVRQRQIQIDTMFLLSMFLGDLFFSIQSLVFVILLEINKGWNFGKWLIIYSFY